MKDLTFDEFAPNGYDDWKKLVQKELGTQSYDAIVWKNENGFEVEPYLIDSALSVDIKIPDHCDLCQQVDGSDATTVNQMLLNSLTGGAEAIAIGLKIDSRDLFIRVLQDIRIDFIATHFIHPENSSELVSWLIQYCDENSIDTKTVRGSFAFHSLGEGVAALSPSLLKFATERFSLFKVLTIDATKIHQQGALPVHELAFALATGNELMHQLTSASISVDDASAMLQFNFSVGASYFTEIAKLRAFRNLWATVIREYKPQFECSEQAFIYAVTSSFLQTQKDHHNNLLRATTQTMSAMIGGANSILILPAYHREKSQDEISLRIARNIHHLLVEESYLDQLKDVAAGSFYIDSLASKLQEKSWGIFQQMESKGGILTSSNLLNQLVAESLEKRREDLRSGKKIVVGVNKYQNKNESAVVNAEDESLTGFLEKE